MANTWHIDLGFDWNAQGTTSGTTTTYPLQIGVVFQAGGTGTPDGKDMVNGANGDTINVYIYDVTANSGSAVSGSAPSLPAGWLTWTQGDTRNSANAKMLSASVPSGASVGNPSGATTGYSSIFSPTPTTNFPYWAVLYNMNVWAGTLYNNTSKYMATINTFSVTLTLNVSNGGVTKQFVVDPEMIVDP